MKTFLSKVNTEFDSDFRILKFKLQKNNLNMQLGFRRFLFRTDLNVV